MHLIVMALVYVAAAFEPRVALLDGEWFRQWLVLERTGERARAPILADGLTSDLALDALATPAEGRRVLSTDGTQREWSSAEMGEDGWLVAPALRGGHAAHTVYLDRDRTMLLDASGHNVVYINGLPRTGDPYTTGFVRLPIRLRAGANQLIFSVSRGRLRARLLPLRAEVQLNSGDVTLPDISIVESGELLGAIVVINGLTAPLLDAHIETQLGSAEPRSSAVPVIERLSVRKVPFRFEVPPGLSTGELPLSIHLLRGKQQLDSTEVNLKMCTPAQACRHTFISEIDHSVQYYALRQATEPGPQAMILTLHGAGVEAIGQAQAYASKPWGHIVAPTNRRPFGFDWEDWGRWDALEVLAHARGILDVDPERVYLTGHSMGGHGTWHIGVTFPDRFAAIGPSAGWASFWSYGGAPRYEPEDPMTAIFRRATRASDTGALLQNLERLGVYVLHGARDDNVPVSEARRMRAALAEFHPDFAYHEQSGAGHWWGNACVDWPEMFEFFGRRRLKQPHAVRSIRFYTVSPAVSARSDWVTVQMQHKPLRLSRVELSVDVTTRRFVGSSENITRMSIDLNMLSTAPAEGDSERLSPGVPLALELDGQTLSDIAWPADGQLRLHRHNDQWTVAQPCPPTWKNSRRYGPFKNVFRNDVMLVYGTAGSDEDNAWAFAKARYDAETWWYRGNGSIDVLPDTDYDPAACRDRNVVLYGNADTNRAWPTLLAASPVQVRRGSIQAGEDAWNGADLAALFIRPLPGSTRALVGVVGGTGPAGIHTTSALPYFVSGVGYPDCTILKASALREGLQAVLLAGFFDERWNLKAADFAVGTPAE